MEIQVYTMGKQSSRDRRNLETLLFNMIGPWMWPPSDFCNLQTVKKCGQFYKVLPGKLSTGSVSSSCQSAFAWNGRVAETGKKSQTGQFALRGGREKFWDLFIVDHFVHRKTNCWICYSESFKAF